MIKKKLYNLLKKIGFSIENTAKRDKLLFNELSKIYHGDNYRMLIRCFPLVKDISSSFPELVIVDEGSGFIIEFDQFRLYIETIEEIIILNEVFVRGDYQFYNPNVSVVIDVGGNIGLSAIYFAKSDFIEKVFSFEPVIPTYLQARKNLELNPQLINKIEFFNVGLSNKDEECVFMFNPNVKGNTGVRGEKSKSFKLEKSTGVKVQLKNASATISEIIKDYSTKNLVLKWIARVRNTK
jgi:FkbM family methyltransferase